MWAFVVFTPLHVPPQIPLHVPPQINYELNGSYVNKTFVNATAATVSLEVRINLRNLFNQTK